MAHSKIMGISDVILQHTFSYLNADELTLIRVVCSYFKDLADDSIIWPELCRDLWSTKQNHPYEQWIRINSQPFDELEMIRHQIETIFLYLLLEGRASMSEFPYESLVCLKFIRLMSKKREAAPISHYLREEQILLENQLLELSAEDPNIETTRQRIILNIQTPVNITTSAMQTFRDEGTLLTWRESYIASVIDSTRCCLTYPVIPLPCISIHDCYPFCAVGTSSTG